MDQQFSVYLGGGLYMDSDGVLSHGPVVGKPVYPTPGGGLPVDPDAVAKAFQGVAKALPNAKDPESRKKFDKILDGIGMAAADKENLIGTLQSIGAVASTIGSIVPVVGAVLAVLTLMLGLFKSGRSAVEILVMQRMDDLARQLKALEVQLQQKDLRDQRTAISAALATVANYVVELKNSPPDEATLLLRQQDVRTVLESANVAVRRLLDTSTSLSTFDQKDYQHVWPFIASKLFTMPNTGGPLPANYPQQGTNHFDHQLMVPLSMFAVSGYLTVLRASVPEFRSTREHREDLWDYVTALDILAGNMRREGLARTIYTPAHFQGGAAGGIPWGLDAAEVIDPILFPARLAPGSGRFPVGALDLWGHHDGYFTPQFSTSPTLQFPGAGNAKQGLMDAQWLPPAKLERYEETLPLGGQPSTRYRITNPEECAAAANKLADESYVDLLYSSGYLNLVHLIATLRNEATDPDSSQTVRSDAWLGRRSGASTQVVVQSAPQFMSGVVSSTATKRVQESRAVTWFTTQPLGRQRKLNYRVWLRVLHGLTSNPSRYLEQGYEEYHQVGYVDDPARRPSKKLVTTTGAALSELKLAEGVSIAELRESHGTATLTANTFETWIPVAPLAVGITAERVLPQAKLRAVGYEVEASETLPSPSTLLPRPGPVPVLRKQSVDVVRDLDFAQFVGWDDGDEPATGQRRRAAETTIHLDYALRWQADRLSVSLRNNRPEDRNYIVYVVVEETLGSGEVLHTVERVPIFGQLTYVPKTFFAEEAAAREKTAKFFREFAGKYAISISPVPQPRGQLDTSGWRLDELLASMPDVVASDPVLRAISVRNFAGDDSYDSLARLASENELANGVLRDLMRKNDLPEGALERMLEGVEH